MSRVQWLGEVNCFDKCGWKPGEPDPTGTKALCVKGCLGQTAQQWPTQQTAQSLQPTSAPSQVTTFPVPDPGCLTDCENKWGISGGNWNAVELAKCVAACKGQAPATPAPPQVVTPPPGGSTPAPGGGGGSTPAPGGGISNTSEEKKTPWGWIILGGAALIGGAFVLLRGAGELGGAMASNPSDPKVYLSMSEGRFRVIQGGVPISADLPTAAQALAVAKRFNLQVSDRMWNGDTGKWEMLGGAMASNPSRRLTSQDLHSGLCVEQIDHPEYGTWTIQQRARGTNNTWEVRGNSGLIAVDGAELVRFWQKCGAMASNPSDWWGPGQRWLEGEARKEAASQLAAHVKRGRSRNTFRYSPPDWHRDAMDALGKNDEERFKAIKLAHIGWGGAR